MILVTGDAMLDRYWFGTVNRVSPEAPVPVLAHGREEEREGGAANVARNVEAMGAQVRTVFSRSYREQPVLKLRLIARTQQIARVDFDYPQEPVDIDALREAARGCSVAVISDYAKGALPDPQAVVEACRAAGAFVLVDPKGSDASRYSGADVIKPNHFELQALIGAWRDEADLEDRARRLCRVNSIGAVLMTRGDRGMSLFRDRFESMHIEGRHLELCDVSGAGDTAIAALAVALDLGQYLTQAALAANRAAGAAVTRFGTTVVTHAEVFG